MKTNSSEARKDSAIVHSRMPKDCAQGDPLRPSATNSGDSRERPADIRIERARKRFGRAFAHEPGTDWRPRETPFLTEWMARQVKERA